MTKKGYIHLYVGDGKGKTTAAAGLALRAVGWGWRVVFAQFLKGRQSGEVAALQKLGATTVLTQTTGKFTNQMTPQELAEQAVHSIAALDSIREMLGEGCELLVLDEVVDAVNCGFLPLAALLEFLHERPGQTEVVLTGRKPPPELAALADYHTEFACRAHPYEKGVSARKGIEY